MNLDKTLTDVSGLAVIVIGLFSLMDSLFKLQGNSLPTVKGTMLSLFVISFGAVLMTESATKAFKELRMKYRP
ncbi:MAG: hypothetical protein ABEK00_00450 [Candidatus Nanohaloarchaea archaeon]